MTEKSDEYGNGPHTLIIAGLPGGMVKMTVTAIIGLITAVFGGISALYGIIKLCRKPVEQKVEDAQKNTQGEVDQFKETGRPTWE